jgi:hypothetical protein
MSHTALYKKISMMGCRPRPSAKNKEYGVPRGKSDNKEGCGRIEGRHYKKGSKGPFLFGDNLIGSWAW